MNVSVLKATAARRAQAGYVDPVCNIKKQRIFLYRGRNDTCYTAQSVSHTAEFFRLFEAKVHFENSTIPSLHAIPTLSTGTPCGTEGNYTESSPHGLEACDYNGVFHALNFIHGGKQSLNPPSTQNPGSLFRFDQTEFDLPRAGLDINSGGFVYIPIKCKATGARCGIHVFVHGCGMAAYAGPKPYAFNDTYARRAGFNEVAESNGFIILYPQLRYDDRARSASEIDNCWDQTGTTGVMYTDKAGAQVTAVMRMIERLQMKSINSPVHQNKHQPILKDYH